MLLALPFALAAACTPEEPDDDDMMMDDAIAADELCMHVAAAICEADTNCCSSTPSDCVEEQKEACEAAIQPLVDDPRLGYDPVGGAKLVASLKERGAGCWTEAPDYGALLGAFAGTGTVGADCTPPSLTTARLRESAISCARGLACRLSLRADGSYEGECAERTDDACSHPLDCGPDQFCSLPGNWRPGVWGTCRPLRADGWACTSDLECASRHCDEVCGQPRRSQLCLATSYADLVLESQPLTYLSFDETSGAVANDLTGNVNGGTLSHGAMRDPENALAPAEPSEEPAPIDAGTPDGGVLDGGVPDAHEGGSIRFAADDAAVRVTRMSELAEADAITFEAWIRIDSAETGGPILEINDGAEFGVHLWTFDQGDKLYANFVSDSGEERSIMTEAETLQAGQWHHVVLTHDGTKGRLYLDGRLLDETEAAGPLRLGGDLYVGHRPSGDTPQSFRGLIDEVAIYARALEAAEITEHHRTGANGPIRNRFPLFRWISN